jgi:hypothetical protein
MSETAPRTTKKLRLGDPSILRGNLCSRRILENGSVRSVVSKLTVAWQKTSSSVFSVGS